MAEGLIVEGKAKTSLKTVCDNDLSCLQNTRVQPVLFDKPVTEAMVQANLPVDHHRVEVPGTLAISAGFLSDTPVYHDSLESIDLVVLTDKSGANRVYDAGGRKFASYDGDRTVVDSDGNTWQLSEDSLTSSSGEMLDRLAAHRAFWFGWYAANRDTRLVTGQP